MKNINEKDNPTGFLLIDKPEGPTSHDMVSMARNIFGIRKIGHAGTLDPFASGLIVLCLGSATRISEHVMKRDKRYIFTLMLGLATDSYDKTGKIVFDKREKDGDVEPLKEEIIRKTLKEFTGEIEQTPPVFSAIKIRGRKLYDYARKGEPVEPKPRIVTVFEISLLNYRHPRITLEAKVSSGTYIRSLGNDIGKRLGVGAYVESLRRTAIGNLHVEKAIRLDAQKELEATAFKNIIRIQNMFPDWLKIMLPQEMIHELRNGKSIPHNETCIEGEREIRTVLILDKGGKEVCKAVFKKESDDWYIKPERML